MTKLTGPIGLVNDDAVFIKLLDGSDLKLTCVAGPYAIAVYEAIATALRTARNEVLEEAADAWEGHHGFDRDGVGDFLLALKHKDGQP